MKRIGSIGREEVIAGTKNLGREYYELIQSYSH